MNTPMDNSVDAHSTDTRTFIDSVETRGTWSGRPRGSPGPWLAGFFFSLAIAHGTDYKIRKFSAKRLNGETLKVSFCFRYALNASNKAPLLLVTLDPQPRGQRPLASPTEETFEKFRNFDYIRWVGLFVRFARYARSDPRSSFDFLLLTPLSLSFIHLFIYLFTYFVNTRTIKAVETTGSLFQPEGIIRARLPKCVDGCRDKRSIVHTNFLSINDAIHTDIYLSIKQVYIWGW